MINYYHFHFHSCIFPLNYPYYSSSLNLNFFKFILNLTESSFFREREKLEDEIRLNFIYFSIFFVRRREYIFQDR